MATELTDPDNDSLLEFTHTVEDADGDTLSITVELHKVNGVEQSGSDRNPSWLSHTSNSSGGTPNVVDVNVELDKTQLGGTGTVYTFQAIADDGSATTLDTFTLSICDLTGPTDGDRFYLVSNFGGDSGEVIQINTGTNFDLNDISSTNSQENPILQRDITNVAFDSTGEKAFYTIRDKSIVEVSLNTPFDLLGGGSKNAEFTGVTNPSSTLISPCGTTIIVFDKASTTAIQYSLDSQFNIGGTVTQENSQDLSSLGQGNCTSISINHKNGLDFYAIDPGSYVGHYILDDPWTLTGWTKRSETQYDDTLGSEYVYDMQIGHDGATIWYNTSYNNVYWFDLGTPWDTSTYYNERSISHQSTGDGIGFTWK